MTVPVAPQTLAVRPYDGVFDMWNIDYSIVYVLMHNAHAGTISITAQEMIGLPVVFNAGVAKLTAAASASTYNAVILRADAAIVALATATDSTVRCMLLVRGPAILIDSMIILLDAADAVITLATVKTALIANCSPPILTKIRTSNNITSPK